MSLGEKIKACRQNAGMSQEKVAELVGVSRQAVTKWEVNQSAPNTENLFKLAEIFGTTVDLLLASQETGTSPAEQIYHLYKMDEKRKTENRRTRLKSNLLLTLAVIGGYIVIYLTGRIFGTTESQMSVTGWLFGNEPQQLSYLYGWLLHQHIFWVAMAISAIPTLFGKKYFSFTTLFGFAVALLIGELCGHNPAGSAYGYGHYGWAIWGCIFAFSVVMGIILEKITEEKFELRAKKIGIWFAIFVVGVLAIVLAIRAGMPVSFG